MANTKGVGPEGPIQPTGSREKRLPSDPEAFQKKLDKAGETDPEEKKKRRQKEEETEEITDKMKEADKAARTKDMIAPFEINTVLSAKPSLDKGAPTTAAASGPITPPLTNELDDETQFWEEEDFDVLSQSTTLPKEQRAAIATPQGSKGGAVHLEKGGKKGEAHVAPLSFEEALRKRGEKESKGVITSPLFSDKMATAPIVAAPDIAPPPTLIEATPYAHFSPAVLALFERLVGVMTVMTQSGVTETTISLSSDQFKSSSFFGSEIVIREYSTAPKQFNVEVRSNPEAAAQFQANIPNMELAFRNGKYNFGIHRLETSIKRIEDEPVSRDKKDKEEG